MRLNYGAFLLLCFLQAYRVDAQILQCTTVPDGCDGGSSHESTVRAAIARFDTTSVYGGILGTFSSAIDGSGAAAYISYTCLDGSTPPPLTGSTVQSLLNRVANCPDRCGSVSVTDQSNCGFGVLVANGAASLECSSKAINVVPQVGKSTEKPSAGNFGSKGCWTDSVDARALTGGSATAEDMTIDKCVSLAKGFRYAGIEYKTECYWGNAISPTSTLAPDSPCDMPCGGDATELCGGGNLINVYEDSTWKPPPTSNPTPTLIPSVGNYWNPQCFFDTTTARVLVADSTVDQTQGTGMTVQKCVEFASKGNWRYAGVEYGGECFVGNTLHGPTQASLGDCNMACVGNASEFCGNGNRILVYTDLTWQDPTADQLGAVLREYNSTINDVRELVLKYEGDIKDFQDLQRQGLRRRRGLVKRVTRTLEDITESITDDSQQFEMLTLHLVGAESSATRLVDIAANLDIERTTSPILEATDPTDLQQGAASVRSSVESIRDAARDDASMISRAGSSAPILNTGRDIAATSRVLSAIGKWGLIAASGTGLLLTIATIFGKLFASGSPGGGDPGNGGQTEECTVTRAPRAVLVTMTKDAKQPQYEEVIAKVRTRHTGLTISEIVYDAINFRAFVADLDNCDTKDLRDNPIVATMSLDIEGDMETFANSPNQKRDLADADASLWSRAPGDGNVTSVVMPDTSNSTALEKRVIPAEFEDLEVAGALWDDRDGPTNKLVPFAWHLALLTSPWAQKGLTGKSFLGFQQYLYKPSLPPVRVYVIDTGARLNHQEWGGNTLRYYDATTRSSSNLEDSDGHGTCMASCVGGKFSGVYKQAEIVPVKVLRNSRTAPKLSDVVDALAWIERDMLELGGPGVLSMSIGFPVGELEVDDVDQRSNTFDPFTRLLADATAFNLVAVASSGNYADQNQDLNDATPRRNGGMNTDLIVVGATDKDEQRWPKSTYLDRKNNGILSIYANGVDVVCANRESETGYKRNTGSSPATAQVAGIIAMALAGGRTTVANAKSYLLDEATRLKGSNWPADSGGGGNGPPRAAIGLQVPCTLANPPEAIAPLYERPDEAFVGDDIRTKPIKEFKEPPCVRIP